MLDNTLTFDYDGNPVNLKRINQDDFSSVYYGAVGNDKVTMTIKHTIPPRGQSSESHLVRFDVELYDADGVYTRTASAWTVIKTFDGVQDDSETTKATGGLLDFLGTGTYLAQIIGRES
jgi:hypothetical protein